MSLLYHTRFKIPLVLACLYILFLKNIVFLDKGLAMPIKHVLCYTNIEAICEIGNPTNAHSGELF